MSLRTQRGLALGVALLFVAAACTATPPATPDAVTPAPAPATADPAPATADPGTASPDPAPATADPGTESPDPGTESPAPATADPGTESPDPGPGEPGGRIILGEWQAPITLMPYFSNTFTTSKAVSPVLKGLLSVNNEGEWFPYLAAEIPTTTETEEGFTLDIQLKPDLMWSDGEPLTLNDFAFTYDWAVETATAGVGCQGCGDFALLLPETDLELPLEEQYAPENQYVQSIEVSDDGLSATVTWQRKYAGWLAWVAQVFLPEHYFTNITPDQAAESMPVTDAVSAIPASGPFVFASASSQGIDYAPNPNFAAFDGPNLESLGYRYFGTKDGMITAFLTGEVDFIDNMTQADYDAIVTVPADVGQAQLHSAWQYEHLDINTSRAEVGLDDPNVRRAIHHAMNKEDLWNVLFPGSPFEEACTNAPPGTWWRAEDITCPQYDTAEAARLLDEAGWTLNDAGVRANADGTVMRLQMCTTSGNPTRLTNLGKVNEYLLAVGIPTDIMTADAGSVYFAGWADTTPETECSIYRGTYDLALFTYILGADPGALYYALYHSSQIPSDANPNGGNDTRMNHPDMDAALEAFTEEVDLDILLDSSRQIQQLYADLTPEIALYYRAEPSGVGRHLGGFLQNPSTAGPMWNVHEWSFIP